MTKLVVRDDKIRRQSNVCVIKIYISINNQEMGGYVKEKKSTSPLSSPRHGALWLAPSHAE